MVCTAQSECHDVGTCNTGTGVCSNPPKSNGTACTDDGNDCTNDTCNGSGSCTHPNKANGAACGSATSTTCNGADTCNGSGTCLTNLAPLGTACGSATNSPPCNLPDTCDGLGACNPRHAAGTTECRPQLCQDLPPPSVTLAVNCDGSGNCPAYGAPVACPGGAVCAGNSCNSSCTNDTQCQANFWCNTATSTCQPDLGPGATCQRNAQCASASTSGVCVTNVCCLAADCSDGRTCTTDSCQAGTGACVNTPVNSACNDSIACTTDTCNPATGNPTTGCVNTPVNSACNDGVACTTDTCSAATGCSNTPVNAACSDGQFCNGNETCNAVTGCQPGTAVNCDDSVNCTNDACNESLDRCDNVASNANCDDGQFCNGSETCSALLDCQAGTPPNCADAIACTVDTCNETTDSCDRTPNNSACGDSNVCTSDVCSATTGCSNPPVANGTACPNSTLCDGSETCQAGTCTAGTPPNCNDGNECTTDSCSATLGCRNIAVANGTACTDDGESCTTDSCQSGVCQHPAGNSGLECRATAGPCDVAEACTGAATSCPTNAFVSAATQCRPPSCTAGVETVPANCPGNGPNCPALQQNNCSTYRCDGATSQCFTTCTTDAECSVGNYCSAGACVPKVSNGTTCTAANQCASGNCVDGVCCNSGCTRQCEACDVTGAVGTCTPVTGAPHGARTACLADGTGCDGFCDGSNAAACSQPGATTACRAPSCTGGVATLGAFCDGSGACPAVQTQDCGTFTCGATACNGNCTVDTQCIAGHYCSAGVCSPKKPNGEACTAVGQCLSGRCADGVCCNTACGAQCEACNLAGSLGVCSPVTGAPVNGRAPCLSDGSVCGGACDGTKRNSCTYAGQGVECRAASCSNDVATAQAFCNGAGLCPAEQQQMCSGTCVGNACGDCSVDGDCSFGEFCLAGSCVPTLANGSACAASSQCTSQTCIDGFCCNSACLGQCQACDVAGSEGICTPVTGSPHGTRPGCTGDGSACAGTCDGVDTAGCTYPGSSTICRAATCAAGVATLEATCQGTGSCPALQTQPCGVFTCGATACAGDCTTTADCSAGTFCSGGVCVPRLVNGAPCGALDQCQSGNCVDGRCCNTTCSGQCQSCDLPTTEGTCMVVTGLPSGGRPACGGTGPCGAVCDGVDGTQCAFPDSSATCGVASCSGVRQENAALCNGAGTCLPPTITSCSPFLCDVSGTACTTSCSDDTECDTGFLCVGNVCVPPAVDAGADAAVDAGDDAAVDAGADAAAPDASVPDATTDAGAETGTPDAGTDVGAAGTGGVDGGAAGAGATGAIDAKDEGSCGCRAPGTGRGAGGLGFVLAALGLGALRRRRAPRPAV